MNPSIRIMGIAAALFGLGAVATHASPVFAQITGSVTGVTNAAQVDVAATPAPLSEAMRGRPLSEQVGAYGRVETENAEQDCLANAVYFEARGEPIEGQLAVAEVVLNRTRSGRYPTSICGVVTQPAQFSFVRHRQIPAANRGSDAWRRAVAIARIAQDRVNHQLEGDVLWYHANYVSPSWGRRLNRTSQIGAHIFYR
jgi:spore germination cell wall hydrolase CwlJ-like protein